MTNSEIKKCPFCGENPVCLELLVKKEVKGYRYGCIYGMCANLRRWFDTEEEARKYWNRRTPEPTKAENGLVPLNIDKVANAIRVFDGNHDKGAGQIAEHICKTFGTPSITKEQLLAIVDNSEKEYFSEGAYYRTDIPQGIVNYMKQRIEERFE